MPQLAVKGIYTNGKIIPTEEIPFNKQMDVIIVFTAHESLDTRYYKNDWRLAETQASEDYQKGNIRSANSIDQMFDKIAMDTNGS